MKPLLLVLAAALLLGKLRVYLMRSAARRGESAKYRLEMIVD